MRNLKKFLALVLAMMMAFSLMVTANASTTGTQYPDVTSVDPAFEEAVDVLTGMDIFKGDDNGNFNAKANVTRAEMAAIIYRVATGDVDDTRADLYKEYGNFSDVTPDKWYAGYVGYAANAGFIKGRSDGTFDATANVTGYEALAMLLRVVGYDKEDEFTGGTWQVNVSALATRLGILSDLKNANYDANLQYASLREVIASLTFNTLEPVNWVNGNNLGGPVMVTWTPALHYQTWNYAGDMADASGNGQSVGQYIFGLAVRSDGVVIGNEQTGEAKSKTVLGFSGSQTKNVKGGNLSNKIDWTEYTYKDNYDIDGESEKVALGANTTYGWSTGIDLLGHNVKIWYTTNGGVTTKFRGNDVFAYYDNAKIALVKADNTNLDKDSDDDATDTDLYQAIAAAGFKTSGEAVFNNSFGRFGSGDEFDGGNGIGTGLADTDPDAITSPVKLYKIINNPGTPTVDAIISLNIETSQITEANIIRNVHTLGMPVANGGTWDSDPQLDMSFIDYENPAAPNHNTKKVGTVDTGVIAKDALVGSSTSTLKDYEMGIHITGTQPRDPDDNEIAAINGTATEAAYFLLDQVLPTVTGKVVAYNAVEGTVHLDNGTVLNRSKFYDTVVDTVSGKARENMSTADKKAASYALPQSFDENGEESYNFAEYKFYTDYEGNYLGAERSYGNDFLYATYVDYTTDVNSSTFTYTVTGVDINGETKTVPVSKFFADKDPITTVNNGINTGNTADDYGGAATGAGYINNPNGNYYQWADTTGANTARGTYAMAGTNNLGVPFRDTVGINGVMNYVGLGMYKGMTISNGTASPYTESPLINNSDYSMNMARLGILQASESGDFDKTILIRSSDITLGVVETMAVGIDSVPAGKNSNLFFNEETKFIVVDGYGTATLDVKVYNGISELKGDANYVTISMNPTQAKADVKLVSNSATDYSVNAGEAGAPDAKSRIIEGADWNAMTYFTKSPFTYDQTGSTAEKVNVIILPKQAVYWDTTTTASYYMGDPTATLVSSHEGTPIYQYTVYQDGVARTVWLTNAPSDQLDDDDPTTLLDNPVKNDTFLTLGSVAGKTDTGEEYYTAVFSTSQWNGSASGATNGLVDVMVEHSPALKPGDITSVLDYTATTREAQAGTFTLKDSSGNEITHKLLNVAGANVTNLNAANSPKIEGTDASGYIWPDIVDVASLNAAGSINPVTGANVRVAIEYDGLVVSQIYVCWDQNQSRGTP